MTVSRMAQAIMEKEKFMMLNEPTNSPDEDGVRRFRQVIKEEKARGESL